MSSYDRGPLEPPGASGIVAHELVRKVEVVYQRTLEPSLIPSGALTPSTEQAEVGYTLREPYRQDCPNIIESHTESYGTCECYGLTGAVPTTEVWVFGTVFTSGVVAGQVHGE